MYNKAKEDLFDAILTTAFIEYWDRELEKMPSDEELKKMYPLPKKGLRLAKNLEKRRKYGKSPALVYLQRASTIVLVIIAVMAGILAASPKIRAAVSDSVTTWFHDHIVLDFTKDPVTPVPENQNETSANSDTETGPVTVETLKIGYIPDGFELVNSEEFEDTRKYTYISENEYVMITIAKSSLYKVAVDIELSDYTEISINKNKAYFLYNEADGMGTIVTGNDNYVITVTGVINEDALIEISNNIK